MKIPFFSIERRVEKASKIAIEARMQNIITESVVVVKFIGFQEIILWVVRQLQDTDQYQELFFFANFYNVQLDVHLEELNADEEDKLEELRMTYRMCT